MFVVRTAFPAPPEVAEPGRPARPSGPDAPPVEVTHLVATLPGESSDRFLLAAPYDTRAVPGLAFVGANASASGPALVLELARVLSRRPRPYTLTIAFVDGDRLPPSQPGAGFPGSRSFAAWLAQEEPAGPAGALVKRRHTLVGNLEHKV